MATEQKAEHATRAYVAALEHEAEGYRAKISAAKATGDKVGQALYEGRLKQVEEEMARARKQGRTPAPKAKGKKTDTEASGEDAGADAA